MAAEQRGKDAGKLNYRRRPLAVLVTLGVKSNQNRVSESCPHAECGNKHAETRARSAPKSPYMQCTPQEPPRPCKGQIHYAPKIPSTALKSSTASCPGAEACFALPKVSAEP